MGVVKSGSRTLGKPIPGLGRWVVSGREREWPFPQSYWIGPEGLGAPGTLHCTSRPGRRVQAPRGEARRGEAGQGGARPGKGAMGERWAGGEAGKGGAESPDKRNPCL